MDMDAPSLAELLECEPILSDKSPGKDCAQMVGVVEFILFDDILAVGLRDDADAEATNHHNSHLQTADSISLGTSQHVFKIAAEPGGCPVDGKGVKSQPLDT
jgi:hypothetical protein